MIKATLETKPRYLTQIQIDDHIQLLDEPVSLGGTNQGPTPMQSLFAALSGCISITIRMYADMKKIPLKKIEVAIKREIKAVEEDDERFIKEPQMVNRGKVQFIHADIVLFGDLDPKEVKKIDVIAGKCPVHKILKHGAWITHSTRLAE